MDKGNGNGQRQPDQTLCEECISIEHKNFTLALKENGRGKFVRITEESGGRFNSIVVPESGIGEFTALLRTLIG